GRFGVAFHGAEIVAVPEGAERAVGEAAWGDRDPRSTALPLFVPGVEEEGLVERIDQVGALGEERVVDGHRADDAARAAAAGGAQAEESDGVGEVAVPADVPRRAVAADEGIGRVLAGVDDVAEELALRVLGAGSSEVLADAPVRERGGLVAPAGDGKAAHEEEAAAVEQLVGPGADASAERVEREVLAPHLAEREAARLDGGARPLELRDLVRPEPDDPVLARRHLAATPRRRDVERRSQRRLVLALEVVQRLGAEAREGGRHRRRRVAQAAVGRRVPALMPGGGSSAAASAARS